MRASAIIINFNSGSDLTTCMESLRAQTHPPAEVIVVDNASSDESLHIATATFPEMLPVRNLKNVGFAAAANQGAAVATGEILVFLNPDVLLDRDCIAKLCESLESQPGVVGPVMSLAADADDLRGSTIDRLGYPSGIKGLGEPLYVAGAALATTRSLFVTIGGFDERYFMFVEDVDYCWRALLSGYSVTVCDSARASHRGGSSAVGGYVRRGKLETTTFRFALRERNTLATLLKCASKPWLAWCVPVYVGKIGVLCLGALYLRRPDLTLALIKGLVWNFGQLPRTFRRRRRIARTPRGEAVVRRRIYRGWFAIEQLRAAGMPRFIDSGLHSLDQPTGPE